MAQTTDEKNVSRRKFLKAGALAAGAGAATLAMPNVSRAETVRWRIQSGWPTGDIFHENSSDYVRIVRELSGGRMEIDLLPAGAVVGALELQDAIIAGALEGYHGVTAYWYGKHKAASLFGTGPVFGFNANEGLGWIYNGGGQELFDELQTQIMKVNVKSFFAMPMPTQPLGWFKKPITKVEDFKGLKFRTVGVSIDVFTGLGAAVNALPGGEIVPAMDRGLLDAAEFNNATSDRILGFPDVSKVCMLQSYHQNAEQFEIMFNKPKFDALPAKIKAIIENAVEAASSDMSWKAVDRYSKDYVELQTKDKVRFYKTPDSVLARQLDTYDAAAKKRADNALWVEIEKSQREFASRAVRWYLDTQVNARMAYSHYFGKPAGKPAAKKA
jgi:TRAP-type mannitol/chloroaromatic compound transport system substrate-binding protein